MLEDKEFDIDLFIKEKPIVIKTPIKKVEEEVKAPVKSLKFSN